MPQAGIDPQAWNAWLVLVNDLAAAAPPLTPDQLTDLALLFGRTQ